VSFGPRWTPPPRARDLPPPAPSSLRPLRRGCYAGTTSGQQLEKEDASQSTAYTTAAKALGYCMRCDIRMPPLTGLLDFCHADLGKGQGFKTDVRRGWPGCRRCHEIVGRQLPKAVRRAVELLLGAMTRAAVLEAGTWPKRLDKWGEQA
jgi:hypothetical protein